MLLKEVEEKLEIKYPNTFHNIYDSGAMDWLKQSDDWVTENWSQLWENPKAFFVSVGDDCRPIRFDNITNEIDNFYKYHEWDEDFKLGKQIINPIYKFIPFARQSRGDFYCFWYTKGLENPKITLYSCSTGEMKIWANSFDEFLFIHLSLSIIEDDFTFEDEIIKFHTQFLNDEYKKIYSNKDVNQLDKIINDIDVSLLDYIVDNTSD